MGYNKVLTVRIPVEVWEKLQVLAQEHFDKPSSFARELIMEQMQQVESRQ